MRNLPPEVDPFDPSRPISISKGGVCLSDAAARLTALPKDPTTHFQRGPGNNAPTLVPPPEGNDDPTK